MHERLGSRAILECCSNKTTHHPKPTSDSFQTGFDHTFTFTPSKEFGFKNQFNRNEDSKILYRDLEKLTTNRYRGVTPKAKPTP